MVSKRHIQTTINISTKYTESQRRIIGERINDRIRQRTQAGINKHGGAFPSYNPEYIAEKGQSNVDLTLTEDMLTELDVIKTSSGKIVIGYNVGHPDAGKAEGNEIGSYGQPHGNAAKARPFIGITQAEKDIILAKADQDFAVEGAEEREEFLSRFVEGIISGQGET